MKLCGLGISRRLFQHSLGGLERKSNKYSVRNSRPWAEIDPGTFHYLTGNLVILLHYLKWNSTLWVYNSQCLSIRTELACTREHRRHWDIAPCCARCSIVHIKCTARINSLWSNLGNTLRNSFVRLSFVCFQFKNNLYVDSQMKSPFGISTHCSLQEGRTDVANSGV